MSLAALSVLALALMVRIPTLGEMQSVGMASLWAGMAVLVIAGWVTVTRSNAAPRWQLRLLWTLVPGLAAAGLSSRSGQGAALAAVATVAIIMLLLCSRTANATGWIWWKPLGLVTVGMAVVTGGGSVIFLLREQLLFNYRSSFFTVAHLTFVACATVLLARFLLPAREQPPTADVAAATDSRRLLNRVWAATLVIGWLGAAAVFGKAGVIPIFSGAIDEARIAVTASGVGLFWPLMQMGMHGGALAICFMGVEQRSHSKAVVAALLSLLPLVLYGGRSMLFLPLAVASVSLAATGRLRRPAWLVAGAVGLLVLGLAYVSLRGFQGDDWRLRFGAAVAGDLFPEMRTLAMVEERLPEGHTIGAQLVQTSLISLIPGKLLSVVGVSKDALWRPVGGDFLDLFQAEFQNVPGLRTGLLGEFYLGFGLGGVVCVLALLLLAARAVQGRAELHVDMSKAYRESWLGVLLASSLLYGNTFLFTVIFVGLPALVLSQALGSPRKPEALPS